MQRGSQALAALGALLLLHVGIFVRYQQHHLAAAVGPTRGQEMPKEVHKGGRQCDAVEGEHVPAPVSGLSYLQTSSQKRVTTGTIERPPLGAAAASAPTRVAVWSAMFGGYDGAPYDCRSTYRKLEKRFPLTVRCFYFTDSQDQHFIAGLRKFSWAPQPIPTLPNMTGNWQNRFLKIFANFTEPRFEDYDFVVYHDSNQKPTRRIADFVKPLRMLQENPAVDLAVFRHPIRDSVAQEQVAVRKAGLCSSESVDRSARLLVGYPDTNFLSENCILFRRGRSSPALRRGQERWWTTMRESGCHRDQLAFNFAMWKENVSYRILTPRMQFWRPLHGLIHRDPLKLRLRFKQNRQESPRRGA